MNLRFVASLLVLGLAATTACGGDDEGTGGNGGSGGVDAAGGGGSGPTGSGGDGGSGPTGSGGDGGSGPTGSGGDGGSGPTGSGGDGGSGPAGSGGGGSGPTGSGGDGGSGPAGSGGGGSGPTGSGGDGGSDGGDRLADGTACTENAECAGDFCKTETAHGYPSGYCSAHCDLGTGDCPGGGVCVDTGDELGECFDECTTNADCREAYACILIASDDGVNGLHACIPACTNDAQCPALGECNPQTGACVNQETNCTDGEDNDEDLRTDCVDDDCAGECAELAEAACAAPQASLTGDTSGGTSIFQASCTGAGREVVHVFEPPAGQSGTLTVVLDSATDHGLYVRTDCTDGETEIECVDDNEGGVDEILEVTVNRGQAVPIIVDAYEPGQEGPYTLHLDFKPAICGDGAISPPEACDDGNAQSGDGCSATCVPETEVFCERAVEVTLGDNAGNTTDGTQAFKGTCNGSATLEDIYRFSPTSNGTLTLELSTAGTADHVLYVREVCGDAASQIECKDASRLGQSEIITLDVTRGEPVFIFVDGYNRLTNAGAYTLNASFTATP